MNLTTDDVNRMVEYVGREGAIAALVSSKKHRTPTLIETARSWGLRLGSRISKADVATAMVRHADRRIKKSLGELKAMSQPELASYFDHVQCDQDELLELLHSVDIDSHARSKKALVEFAASQISTLGVYQRLTDRGRANEPHPHEAPTLHGNSR